MIAKENLRCLSSYVLDNEMYININIGHTENKEKPDMKNIAKEHYKMQNKTMSLSEFAEALGKGRAFFAGKFKKSSDGKIHYSKECLTQSGMLVMDIDNGLYDIGDVHKFLKENGIEPNIIYESFSYSKNNPRFRIIWIIGDMKEKKIIEDLSVLVYELLKKWSINWKMQKEKTIPHIVKTKKANKNTQDYKNIIFEEDRASNNCVQMWQGTKNNVFLYHQSYCNVCDFVNVFYSLASRGHEKRITDILKNKCNIGCIGYIGNRSYKDMSSDYFEQRDTIYQTYLKTPNTKEGRDMGYEDRTENISVWGFKQGENKNTKKPKVEITGEEYTGGDSRTLYSRCRLINELRNEGPHWIDNGGYNTKFKIVTNLKFIPGGLDIMKETICKHSDRPVSTWESTFDRIRTNMPPVPCSEYCPYTSSCKYGRCSMAFAAQKNSWKSEKIVQKAQIEEISLEEAQIKVRGFVKESLQMYKENREIMEGWEYGNRIKRHHMGIKELQQYQDDTTKKIINMIEVLKNTFKVNEKDGLKIRNFKEQIEEIVRYLNNNFIPGRVELIDEIRDIEARIMTAEKIKVDINQRKYDLKNTLNVISVPVGVGKTKSLISSIVEITKENGEPPHVAYAAPSHRLAIEFERDLIEEFHKNGFTYSQLSECKVLRLIPRPELPTIKEEEEIKSLESLGIVITGKMKEYLGIYKSRLEAGEISGAKYNKVLDFCCKCDEYLDNRSRSRFSNILITTHSYIQKAYFQLFDNIDIVFFDEDLCKTSSSQFVMSISQILKMKDNLKSASYEYNGEHFGFNDLIDICDYIITSEADKVVTFDSEKYLCSEIKEYYGEKKVVEYMIDKKFTELSNLRQSDKINYFKLCNIKSFIRHKDKVFFGTYKEINIGNKPLVMLSANPCPVSILEKLTGRENIKIYDTGYIEQKGNIKQCVNIGASRSDLENPEYVKKIKEIIKKENPNCEEVITYKKYKDMFEEFECSMHLGATSGLNSLIGKDISVIGTYHLPAISVNIFAAMFREEGTAATLELPSFRKITYKDIEQKISTYSAGLLREYHLWYMYDEMVQAEGRARTCRTSANVLIFCQLQHPQAEIINESIYIEKKKMTEEEKAERFEKSFETEEEKKNQTIEEEIIEEDEKIIIEENDDDNDLPF